MFMKKSLGLYIHIPFCKSKCPYCNFYSLSYDENLVTSYINRLCLEIAKWGQKVDSEVDTIYFGGGTPSVLTTKEMLKILFCIKENFKVSPTEITIEVNPGDHQFIDFEKLSYYGVNRISLGAQSLRDSGLKILGRRHNVKDIEGSVKIIKDAGISNISLDLILGITEQKTDDIYDFIYFCHQNSILHVSSYMLKIEKNTPYYVNRNNLMFLNDDELADFYFYTCGAMKKFEYSHYEISNFAKNGFESKHNLKYWSLNDYLGLGPSAHSLIFRKRFYYENDLNKFINSGNLISEGVFEPEKELVMLLLRTNEGLTNQKFKNIIGKNIPNVYFEKAQKFEKYGYLNCTAECIQLTEKGFLVSNSIISEIL